MKASKNLNIEIKQPISFNLGRFENNSMQYIQNRIINDIKKEDFDIIAFVAPRGFSNPQNYSKVKKICTI